MSLTDSFKKYCGGSQALAWLLFLLAATGLACMLWLLVGKIAGINTEGLNLWLALSSHPLTALTHFWTLGTYMFLHFSILHLLFNLLWLYWFGILLTDIRSDRTLLTLFIGGGIAGGIFYVIFSSLSGHDPGMYLTGDSSAVLSVMTACGILMPDLRLRLFLIGEVKLKWIAIVCILLTLIGGTGGLAQAAHVGGILWGAGVSLYYKGFLNFSGLKAVRFKKDPKHKPRETARALNRLSDHERLDQLLDKIRLSGYDSLSEREKIELDHISTRLNKD